MYLDEKLIADGYKCGFEKIGKNTNYESTSAL
jgi:hypothetical protein